MRRTGAGGGGGAEDGGGFFRDSRRRQGGADATGGAAGGDGARADGTARSRARRRDDLRLRAAAAAEFLDAEYADAARHRIFQRERNARRDLSDVSVRRDAGAFAQHAVVARAGDESGLVQRQWREARRAARCAGAGGGVAGAGIRAGEVWVGRALKGLNFQARDTEITELGHRGSGRPQGPRAPSREWTRLACPGDSDLRRRGAESAETSRAISNATDRAGSGRAKLRAAVFIGDFYRRPNTRSEAAARSLALHVGGVA